MFRSSTIVRELVRTLTQSHSAQHTTYTPLSPILHSTQHTRQSQDMLPHHHITYRDKIYRAIEKDGRDLKLL
jgi:hypothetical protein